MGRIISWRPTSTLEKMYIAQMFAYKLRAMLPYPPRVFLVGSVANFRDHALSDIDIDVLYQRTYGDALAFRYMVKELARKIYHETGVWVDAKSREYIPRIIPNNKIVEI